MKKFLSILLALAVGFTFTFGSAMSAFADGATWGGYDKATGNAVLDAAYTQAKAAAYKVNYDGKYHDQTDNNGTAVDDITVFEVKAEYVQKAVDSAYLAAIEAMTDTGNKTILKAPLTGTYKADDPNAAYCSDVALVRAALLSEATTTYLADAEKAAFDEYKAMLKSFVESIDLSIYTTTKKDTAYTAKDTNEYYTSAEAAAADKAWALSAIENAKYDASATADANAKTTWKTTYENLYTKLFGTSGVVAVKENNDNTLKEALVTSVYYVLSNTQYATTKSEAAEGANLSLAQATAKAKLLQAVTAWQNGTDYKAKQDAAIAAYVEAETYIIENSANDTDYKNKDYTIKAVGTATDGDITINNIDYIDRCKTAADNKAQADRNKSNAAIRGIFYDDNEAAKALKANLLNVYAGKATTLTPLYTGDETLTASEKAAAKKDYTDAQKAGDKAGYYTFDTAAGVGSKYYAKEWDAVKAAADAYNAAVDAATTQSDIDDAKKAYAKATAATVIMTKSAVDTVFAGYDTTSLATYFSLTKANYNKVNNNSSDIYITWDGESYVKNVVPSDANVIAWIIDKGARTVKEADALYADACKVIDAYKTAETAKAEAEAVKAKIAALPATVALTDKAAIVEAYDAYKALVLDAQKYVTNYGTLKNAVVAVEKLEANDVALKVAALPAANKVTTADKDAVKAAIEAYEAYIETTAYEITTKHYTFANLDTYKANIKAAEIKEIQDLYDPLYTKWSVDKLTAEDAAAVAELQKKLAAYIDEYSEGVPYVSEKVVERMAAVIAALAPEFGDAEAKAYVQDLAVTVRTAKVGKKVKVTVNADVQTLVDNGFTVEYKFYKSTKKSSGYKNTVNKAANTYTNTNPVKGKNYYKVKLVVKNADGAVVATTPLTQCKYGVRTIK